MGGLSQCAALPGAQVFQYLVVSIPRQPMGKRSRLTTQIGPEKPNPESSVYKIRKLQEEEQVLYQNLLQ